MTTIPIRRTLFAVTATWLLSCVAAHGQIAPSVEWFHTFGGSVQDRPYGVVQMNDSGYIIAGWTQSHDGDVTDNHARDTSNDYWVVKVDAHGNLMWKRCYGGINWDFLRSVERTRDGGFVLAGYAASSDGDVKDHIGLGTYNVWVVKCDSVGNIKWSHCYGSDTGSMAQCITQTLDGGYVIAGYARSKAHGVTPFPFSSDFLVVKIDSNGNKQWEHLYGGSREDYANYICQTPRGDFLVAGSTASDDGDVSGNHRSDGGSTDCWIIDIDSNGSMIWQQPFGGTQDDVAYSICATADKGFVVSASSQSNDGDRIAPSPRTGDIWVFKCSEFETIEWQNNSAAWGGGTGTAVGYDAPSHSIVITPDSGYAVASCSGTLHTFDSSGKLEWEKPVGSMETFARPTFDSGYIVVGMNGEPGNTKRGYAVTKLSYFPSIFAAPTHAFRLTCDSSRIDTLYVQNIGSRALRIDSVAIQSAGGLFTLVAPTSLPQSISPGTSMPFLVRYASGSAGMNTATMRVYSNDTLTGHLPWIIALDGRQDSVGYNVETISGDTINFGYLHCGVSSDTTFTLENTSTIATTFGIQTLNPEFTTSADTIQFHVTGDRRVITVRFSGGTTPGTFNSELAIIDTCGRARVLNLIASVDTPRYAITAATDTTICPNQSIVRTVRVRNLSHVSRTLVFSGTDSLFTITPVNSTVSSNDSMDVVIAFLGSSMNGVFALHCGISSDCGTDSSVDVTVNVNDASVNAAVIADTTICPGDAITRRVKLRNVSATPQHVTLPGDGALFTFVPSDVMIAPGDSVEVVIQFAGTAALGTYFVRNGLPSACGGLNSIFARVRVDTASVVADAIVDTTICPGTSITRIANVRNISDSTQHLHFIDDGNFSITPYDIDLAPGNATPITFTFHGAAANGSYTIRNNLPGCGAGHVLAATVRVASPDIAVPATFNVTACPFAATTIPLSIGNRDSIAEQGVVSSIGCSVSQSSLSIAAMSSAALTATFAGADTGSYPCVVHIVDDCGIAHDIVFTVNVRLVPPLNISLATSPTAYHIGDECRVAIIATPRASADGGNFSFTIVNEPTTLCFDSIHTACSATATRGNNVTTLTMSDCSLNTSDTIATLSYRTLVGSTLAPWLRLENTATTLSCLTVTGVGTSTVTLTPPGCELGTVVVHPFATTIQSIYPNPATGATSITYSTAIESPVSLVVYDALGRVAQTLDQSSHKPGVYTAVFDTRSMMSGAYHLMMRVGSMLVVRDVLVAQ